MNAGGYVPKTEWLVRDWHRATLANGTLCIQQCLGCGRYRHPPRRFCARCGSVEATFVAVSGLGTVHAAAISHRSLDPAWQDRVPFTTLVVELDEGPRVLAATDGSPSPLATGDRVVVRVEGCSEDFARLWADPPED